MNAVVQPIRYGATLEEWRAFMHLSRGNLLPVVSRPGVEIARNSKLSPANLGKVPSRLVSGKVVGVPDWTNYKATQADIRDWIKQPDYGICLQTRDEICADVDLNDELAAARAYEIIVEVLVVQPPVRRREGSPRFAVLLRCRNHGRPKQVIHTENGDIEFLGNGQQIVVAGTHPSGSRYQWTPELPTPANITVVSLEQVDELIQRLADEFGVEVEQREVSEAHVPAESEDVPIETVRATLARIKNEPDNRKHYDDWLRIGAGVHSATGGGAAGLAEFKKFSEGEGPEVYDEAETERIWAGYKLREDGAHFSTVRYIANQNSPVNDADLLEGFKDLGDEPVKRTGRKLDWKALKGVAPPKRKWEIEGWLPSGQNTLLGGDPGKGKTLLAQAIGTAIALGEDYIDTVNLGPVVFWAGEDDHDELWRRQQDICAHFQVDFESLEGFHLTSKIDEDMTLAGTTPKGALVATRKLKELSEEVGDTRAKVVIIDSVARAYGGLENDWHQVTQYLTMMNASCHGAAVLLLAHPAKAAGSEFSGSTAWEASVRARWYLGTGLPGVETEEDTSGTTRYLSRRKSNYSNLDWRRFEYRAGILVPDERVAVSNKFSDEYADQLVFEAIVELKKRGERAILSQSSQDHLPKVMKAQGLSLAGLSYDRVVQAANRLKLAGKIKQDVVGAYENRTKKYGLVPA